MCVGARDQRRAFAVLNAAYFALSLTDPALAIAPLVRNSSAVIDVVAAQLCSGLGSSILAGLSTPEQAQAVVDYQLRRLFAAAQQGLCGCPCRLRRLRRLRRLAGRAGNTSTRGHWCSLCIWDVGCGGQMRAFWPSTVCVAKI